jgi:hypothetical protein
MTDLSKAMKEATAYLDSQKEERKRPERREKTPPEKERGKNSD